MTDFELENKQLINDVLERHYYSYFRQGVKKLEIFLNGICKANCDYCYLKKNQKSLFPISLYNEDKIIENLQLILNWYVENEFTCCIDIFSAEWITTPLADKVFDCFYNTFSKVPSNKRPKMFLVADNMQFLKNEELTKKIEYQIERLEGLGIHFPLSASIDGKYCDYGRTENDDEYYAKLNQFMQKYDLRFHPMISADNVKYWIDNYLWFRQTFEGDIAKELMTLEVRNSDWTEESINDLIRYCDFLIDYKFNEFNQDKFKFLKYVLNAWDNDQERYNYPPYNILSLHNNGMATSLDGFNCSACGTLCVRVADLTIAPCHRLFYPELEIGKYNVVNNKITDCEPTNPELLIMETHIKRACLPHCENCKFNDICIGFCQGASYEEYGNLLVPQIEVCKMYKAKMTFLIYKYYTMGIFEELEKLKDHMPENRYLYLVNLINDVVGGIQNER